MSRISSIFEKSGHTALIPYVTVGYPSIEATLEIVPILAENGCDMVELGIPFSDPMADGATIQKASFHAVESGINPRICLETAAKLSREVDIPLAFMSYYNPIFSYGHNEFCKACTDSGISGMIIPDLPPEEGSEMDSATRSNNLDLIYFLAPTSTEERIRTVAGKARGFIYMVSLTGVTGARESLTDNLNVFVKRVRDISAQPLCVGFGISTPEQARAVARIADGVIIGSKIIQLMEADKSMKQVAEFTRQLRNALDSVDKS